MKNEELTAADAKIFKRLLLEAHNALPYEQDDLRERIFKALHPTYGMPLFYQNATGGNLKPKCQSNP